MYSWWVCYEPGSTAFYFDLVVFLYLALLQIVGLVLAFRTRNVKIPVLNDSKFVTALVYISSVVLAALVLTTFLLQSFIDIGSGMFSGGIMLIATLFLILMFLPKVRVLLLHMCTVPTCRQFVMLPCSCLCLLIFLRCLICTSILMVRKSSRKATQ